MSWAHLLQKYFWTISQAILAIRLWAIWGRTRGMGICLSIAFVIYLGVGYAFLELFVESVQFRLDPFEDKSLRGCVTIAANAIYCVVTWIDLLVFETFLTGILLIRGFRAYKDGGNTGLFNVVFRDGLILYLYASGVTIVSLILVISLPPGLVLVTLFPVRAIHVAITSRILLRTREQGDKRTHIFDENGHEVSEAWTDNGHRIIFVPHRSSYTQ
ncbi:hypothetical protein AMATHDRAFT_50011 [Amanita thiersii Skay4041]|uniref:Uncharacterized protein n=1 Tax=Amanita thiersii Skay4041 TaxID=703135 RepID=A0A2A9NB21_9AGAR|nr:hypothetical protein AMATHDRAFT_50011 [Amanita thiersii Skay4041]